jgi:hypothetical protein
MESRTHLKNVREELAAVTDADLSKPIDHVDSDLQEPLKPALEREDVTVSEFADLPSSNKTPRENVRRPMDKRVSVISPLVPASKHYLCQSFSSKFEGRFSFYPIFSSSFLLLSIFIHCKYDLNFRILN